MENTASSSGRLRAVQGDITKLAVTAIVNPTNSILSSIGGIDGIIYRAAGARVLEECHYWKRRSSTGTLPTGQAVATSGGNLVAKVIIHTAGPVWYDGSICEAELLRECYSNCLRIAAVRQLDSVAFPSISTGIYGYPKQEAAAIAGHEIRQWLAAHEFPREVVLVAFDEETRRLYETEVAT